MSNKNEYDGSIPEKVLNQLNEYTAGGFVLFYFNAEDGSPEKAMTFDSPAHSLALQKSIFDWSSAIQDLSIESEKFNLTKACQSQEPNDSDVI